MTNQHAPQAADLDAKLRHDNLVAWLETEAIKNGTDNQRERWAAGLLPEDELLQLARAELFAGFEGMARWHTNEVRKEMRAKLHHADTCRTTATLPEFEVCEIAELGAAEWDTLKKLTLAVSRLNNEHEWLVRQRGNATLEAFTHWATCIGCEMELARSGAKISIPWAGRTLVREFRL